MIPLKLLNILSNIKACKGAFTSPTGAGIRVTIASKISLIPMPFLALANKISSLLLEINQLKKTIFSCLKNAVSFLSLLKRIKF